MKIKFRMHAIKRMFERGISDKEVKDVLEIGEIIKEYPDDQPYPSCLRLAFVNNRPLHIVTADVTDEDTVIIITVYEPDPKLWDDEFKKRVK